MKRKTGRKDPDAALKASAEFKTFESALDAIIRAPKDVVDRQMAEQHPPRPKKSPGS